MNIVRLNSGMFPNKTKSPHYRIGYAHGQKLGKEIQEMVFYLPDFFQETRGWLRGKIAYNFLMKKAQKIKRFIPPEYRSEMLGVADGAGVDLNFILLINVFDELKNIYGCSALAVEDKYGATIDYTIFGDFLGPRNTVFVYQHDKSEHNFVSVSWPGYVGVIRGMNDQGAVLISLSSYSKDQRIKGIPTSFLYREILEKFNSAFSLGVRQRTIGNNILFGNKKEAEIIEVSAKSLAFRKPCRTGSIKFITVTNHYQTAMSKHQRPPKPAKGSTIPKDKMDEYFWGFFDLKGSKKRNNTLQEAIKQAIENSDQFTPEKIKEILTKVANPYTTLNCVIFDSTNLTLYITDNDGKMPATDGKLIKIPVNY